MGPAVSAAKRALSLSSCANQLFTQRTSPPVFHHDSPYDACSPHRNRHSKRAPVMAFDPTIDPMTGEPIGHRNNGGSRGGSNRTRLSPLAAATLQKMDSSAGDLPGEKEGVFVRPSISGNGTRPGRSNTAPLVPSLPMNASEDDLASPDLVGTDDDDAVDRDVEAERAWRSGQGYYTQPSVVPSARYDVANPNADVWGVSSEPWQDFAQPAGRPRDRGARSHASMLSPSPAGGDRSGTASAASSVYDMEAVMTGRAGKNGKQKEELGGAGVSPFDEPNYAEKMAQAEPPKRSKSLIKRIRSMKENPNVPPDSNSNDVELNAMGGRRRYGGGPSHRHSPSSPVLREEEPSSYISARAAAAAAVGVSDPSPPLRAGSGSRRGGASGPVRTPDGGADASGGAEDDEKWTDAQEDEGTGYMAAYGSGDRESTSQNAASASGAGGAGLGRSGSLFNRLAGGKKKGAKRGKSTEREAQVVR